QTTRRRSLAQHGQIGWSDLSDLLDGELRLTIPESILLRVSAQCAASRARLRRCNVQSRLLLQCNSKPAEAAEYWRRYLSHGTQSEWAARARRSLKFCEMQLRLSATSVQR